MTLVTESRFSKTRPLLLTAFVAFFLFPNSFYSAASAGIDASYNLGINLAWKYHLIFGKDFVFTFGPLGILNYRLSVAVPGWVYLLFDVYTPATLIRVFYIRYRTGSATPSLPAVFSHPGIPSPSFMARCSTGISYFSFLSFLPSSKSLIRPAICYRRGAVPPLLLFQG